MSLAGMIRYRFFLYAGLLPYLLGGAWAYGMEDTFLPGPFWLGLLGIFLAVVGVESFNEYFDARMGTDRVFNPCDDEYIPEWMFWVGAAAFGLAALCGAWLAREGGWPVALYMFLGGMAAVFYVGPPIRWVYRGLGETVIALSYGPFMTLGSVHLHTHSFSWGAFWVSLVPGLLIGALAVVNAIPDFHQDRLVGKRNLVVRLGRRGGVHLYIGAAALGLSAALVGALTLVFPLSAAVSVLAGTPFLVASAYHAYGAYDTPRLFIPAVRNIVLCYVTTTSFLIAAVFWA